MYYWPTRPGAVPLDELGWVNAAYLGATNPKCDPTIVWGTTVEANALEAFIAQQREETGLMISPAHVLLRAVTESIHQNPALNRRVIGRRIYQYDGVHVTMPMLETRSGEVNVLFMRDAQNMSLSDIAEFMWEKARDAAVRASSAIRNEKTASWFTRFRRRLGRLGYLQYVKRMAWFGFGLTNRFRIPTVAFEDMNGGNAFVNYLGFPGAPPMTSYKPSLLPTNSFAVSVTMGATEDRAVVENGEVVVRRQAPLYIRVDHRLVNGHQTASFVRTLRSLLLEPAKLVTAETSTVRRAA